jgi:hypothetical protein
MCQLLSPGRLAAGGHPGAVDHLRPCKLGPNIGQSVVVVRTRRSLRPEPDGCDVGGLTGEDTSTDRCPIMPAWLGDLPSSPHECGVIRSAGVAHGARMAGRAEGDRPCESAGLRTTGTTR